MVMAQTARTFPKRAGKTPNNLLFVRFGTPFPPVDYVHIRSRAVH